jgi:hypothetical protein
MKLNEAIEDNRLDEVIGPIMISAALILLSKIVPRAVKLFKVWAEIKQLRKEGERLKATQAKQKAEMSALDLAHKIIDTQKDDPILNKIADKMKAAAEKMPEKDPKEMLSWVKQDLAYYDKIFKELIDYVKSYTN